MNFDKGLEQFYVFKFKEWDSKPQSHDSWSRTLPLPQESTILALKIAPKGAI